MISILALMVLAAYVGWAEANEKIDQVWVHTIQIVMALSSPLWLGGISGIIAVFVLFQLVIIATRRKIRKETHVFSDTETWAGEWLSKYLGTSGGQVLYIIETCLTIILLLL